MFKNVWLGLTTMGEPRLIIKIDSEESASLAKRIVNEVAGLELSQDLAYGSFIENLYLSIAESGHEGRDLTYFIYDIAKLMNRFDIDNMYHSMHSTEFDDCMTTPFKAFIDKLRNISLNSTGGNKDDRIYGRYV